MRHEQPGPAPLGFARALARCVGVVALASALSAPALAQDAGEIAFWKSVENSRNPAEFQAYLDAFPHGHFVPLARLRMARLGAAPAAPPAATPTAPPTAPRATATAPAGAPPAAAPPALAKTAQPAPTLAAAIRSGEMTAVRAAIASGADVNVRDAAGMPPIGLAALLGQADIIALLASSGADVNRNDRFGFTPLMNAAVRGHAGAVRILLAFGADPTLKGRNGNDPLGAARPNGSADRRYDAKMAVIRVLHSAIGARLGAAREGGASLFPAPIGLGALTFPADQPEPSTEPYLADLAQQVGKFAGKSCAAPKFFHWNAAGWDQGRFDRNTKGLLDMLALRGYRLTEIHSPLNNVRVVRVDNPQGLPPLPSLLLAFYLEEKTQYYLMACMVPK
jgi:hypothetical protein